MTLPSTPTATPDGERTPRRAVAVPGGQELVAVVLQACIGLAEATVQSVAGGRHSPLSDRIARKVAAAQAADRAGGDECLHASLLVFDTLARQMVARGAQGWNIRAERWARLIKRFEACGVHAQDARGAGAWVRGQALGRVLAGPHDAWRSAAALGVWRHCFGYSDKPAEGAFEMLAGAVSVEGAGVAAVHSLMTGEALALACVHGNALPPEAAAWLVAGLRVRMDEWSRQTSELMFPDAGYFVEFMIGKTDGWGEAGWARFVAVRGQAEACVQDANRQRTSIGWAPMMGGEAVADRATAALDARMAMLGVAGRLTETTGAGDGRKRRLA